MTTDAVDETLEKIKETLAENEQPLPKVAPTQHYVNNLSLRLSEEPTELEASPRIINTERDLDEIRHLIRHPHQHTFEVWYERSVRPSSIRVQLEMSTLHVFPNTSDRVFILACLQCDFHQVSESYEDLCERGRSHHDSTQHLYCIDLYSPPMSQHHALYSLRDQIIRTPVSQLHEVLPEGSFFTLRCRECDFKFRSVECPLELAHLHSNWQNHVVVCTLHIGEDELQIDTFPVKPSWRERYPCISGWWTRFYRSLWCAGVMVLFLAYSIYASFNGSWAEKLIFMLIAWWWSYDLGCWFKAWRERRKEEADKR